MTFRLEPGTVVAVTGAASHLGAVLVPLLAAHGGHVRAIDLRQGASVVSGGPATPPPGRRSGAGVEWTQAHIDDAASVRAALADVDVVVDVAVGDPSRPASAVGAVLAAVLDHAIAAGVRRVVHVSSAAGASAPAVQALPAGVEVVLVHPTAMIGPGWLRPDHSAELLRILATSAGWVPVTGGGDWVDVRDVAASVAAAITLARSGQRYLLAGHWASVREVAALVGQATGRRVRTLPVARPLVTVAAPSLAWWTGRGHRPPVLTVEPLPVVIGPRWVDLDQAATVLGHRPRPLPATIVDACRWLQSGGGTEPSEPGWAQQV